MEQLTIREGRHEDIAAASDLVVRMKRLNGEFDPLFNVVDDPTEKAEKYLSESIKSEDTLVLVASSGKRVIGVLRADIEDRVFYLPPKRGMITDFYVLPEGRRKNLGEKMLEAATKKLRQMGASIILAEFPAHNEIATKFYTKHGFKPFLDVMAREE